jgi:pimeloyl-ACP methyl ester carboxylesterase
LLGTEGLYDDAVVLLGQLGIDRCHWVGSSIGDFDGVRVAARHPNLVRSLVLIGFSTRRLSRADLRQVNMMIGMVRASRLLGPVGTALLRRVTERAMCNMFGTTFMSDPARADDRERWRQRFTALLVPRRHRWSATCFGHPGTQPELIARIEAPTLIITGEGEPDGRLLDDCLEAQRVIPDARLMTVPGAGHMVLVERPDAGTTAITEFIRGVDAA